MFKEQIAQSKSPTISFDLSPRSENKVMNLMIDAEE